MKTGKANLPAKSWKLSWLCRVLGKRRAHWEGRERVKESLRATGLYSRWVLPRVERTVCSLARESSEQIRARGKEKDRGNGEKERRMSGKGREQEDGKNEKAKEGTRSERVETRRMHDDESEKEGAIKGE